MELYKKTIFEMLEKIIKNVEIEDSNIYSICTNDEKLKINELQNNGLSFKVFKNYNLLNFYKMKKVNDTIAIRAVDNILQRIISKFPEAKYNTETEYVRISISKIEDIKNISDEIIDIFKYFFLQYMHTAESFGCCSKYLECSDNLKCVNNNIRLRLSCIYKNNLENGRIFYGKNKNI